MTLRDRMFDHKKSRQVAENDEKISSAIAEEKNVSTKVT